MHRTIAELKKLGAIDEKLVRLKKLLDLGPQELLRLQESVQAVRSERAGVDARICECATEIDRLALEVKTYEQELADLERKIGIVKNTKEYQIITGRSDEIKRLVAATEGRELDLMGVLEGLRGELAEINERTDNEEKLLEEQRLRFESEAAEIKQTQQELAKKRSEQIARVREIAPDMLAVYSNALKRGKGKALAEVKGGACQGCFRKLQPNMINIIEGADSPEKCLCSGCGKILYLQSAEE